MLDFEGFVIKHKNYLVLKTIGYSIMNKSVADLHRWHRTFIILICLIIQLPNSKVELFFWAKIGHNKFFNEFFKN